MVKVLEDSTQILIGFSVSSDFQFFFFQLNLVQDTCKSSLLRVIGNYSIKRDGGVETS